MGSDLYMWNNSRSGGMSDGLERGREEAIQFVEGYADTMPVGPAKTELEALAAAMREWAAGERGGP